MIQFILMDPLDGTSLTLPSNPEEVAVSSGPNFISVAIDGLGGIKLPSGREPTTYSWDGVFYGPARADLGFLSMYRLPQDIVAQIDNWMDAQYRTRLPLGLTVTETNINKDVWISAWKYTPTGGFGDYKYSLELTEARQVMIDVEGDNIAGGTAAPVGDQPAGDGGEQAPIPATYIVQQDDYIALVAKNVYGDTSRWREIYDANRDVITGDPNDLEPGMVLNIPGGKAVDVEPTTDQLAPLDRPVYQYVAPKPAPARPALPLPMPTIVPADAEDRRRRSDHMTPAGSGDGSMLDSGGVTSTTWTQQPFGPN